MKLDNGNWKFEIRSKQRGFKVLAVIRVNSIVRQRR